LEGFVEKRGCGEEVAKAGVVGGEVWRKLEEQGAEFAGVAGRGECGDEFGYGFVAIAQALEMSDALRSFEAETEAGRGGVEPALQLGFGGQGAEGVVDFDRGEARGVDVQEGARGNVSGVEAGLPCGVGPAGGSGKEIAGRRSKR